MFEPLPIKRRMLFSIACLVLFCPPAAWAGFDSLDSACLSCLYPNGKLESGGLGQAYWDLGSKKAISEKNISLLRTDMDGKPGKEVIAAYSILSNYDPASDNFEMAVPYVAVLSCRHMKCQAVAQPITLFDEGRVVNVEDAKPGKAIAGKIGLVEFLSGAAPIKTITAAVMLKPGEPVTLKRVALVVTADPEDSKRQGKIKMLDLDKDGINELVYHADRKAILDPYGGDKGSVMDQVFTFDKNDFKYVQDMTIECSTALKDERGRTWIHAPVMMFDSEKSTAWCEGTKQYGIAEFIKVEFPDKRKITTLDMLPGWGKSPGTFLSHNQVKTFMVESESKKKFGYTFPQSERELQSIDLLRPVKTRWIRLWIQQIFSARIDETCISELTFE
ncbi:MAG: hypothetical protein GXP49_06350 [Deltaproteobacteria bacterium]|nr:hypothetical protein [Deltaproteobacteria bacterium]